MLSDSTSNFCDTLWWWRPQTRWESRISSCFSAAFPRKRDKKQKAALGNLPNRSSCSGRRLDVMTWSTREGNDGRRARWRCAAGLPSASLIPDPAANDSLPITWQRAAAPSALFSSPGDSPGTHYPITWAGLDAHLSYLSLHLSLTTFGGVYLSFTPINALVIHVLLLQHIE